MEKVSKKRGEEKKTYGKEEAGKKKEKKTTEWHKGAVQEMERGKT